MARNPMPTPSADSSYNFNSDKNKKKKQTAGGVKTVTPPPQPAHEVNRTSGTTYSTTSSVPAPKQTQIYEQPVPKPQTSTQTNRYLSAASSYNPLTVKQNNQNIQNNGMNSIYNKTVTYDAVPVPKTQLKSNKPQHPKGYSYTETKPRSNQYVNNAVNTYTTPKQQMHTPPKPHSSTPPKINIGEYKTLGGYTNANPYVSKDRVDDPWIEYNAGTTKPDWNKLLGINENTDHWGYQKTIKDGAEPKFIPARTPEVNYGIKREMAQSVALKPDPVKELYVEYLKKLTENNKGVNREIAQTSFLDHRDQNPVEKFIERNPFDSLQETQYVTKDKVDKLTPEKIKTELINTGTVVNSEISSLKRQREDLLFEVQYGRRNSDDPELEKLNYDIEYLQHIENKIKMGLKYSYAFDEEELNRLSQMSVNDILNLKEEFNINLPYLSPWAKAARVAGKGVSTYQNSVEVVDSIGVKYEIKKDLFTVFDKDNPQNYFEFRITSEFNPKGYYESKIVVGEHTDIPNDKLYYDLAESLDGLVVSGKVKKQLEYFAEISDRPKLDFDGLGVTDIASYALDVIDLLVIIASDYWEDQKVGIDSTQATFGTIGAWGGSILGSVEGAKIGASLGLAGGPPGAIIGGVLGAAAGAYLLSSAMEDMGRYLGGHINDSDYTIERYYERGK